MLVEEWAAEVSTKVVSEDVAAPCEDAVWAGLDLTTDGHPWVTDTARLLPALPQ